MKRILITATHSHMNVFLIPHIRWLIADGYEVELACSMVGAAFRRGELSAALNDEVKIYEVNLYRNPLKLGNIKGFFQLRKIIREGHYDLIWTNEPVMGVMTRLAAKLPGGRATRVMYMAHGFHFFDGAPLKNWLLFYPIEWTLSWLTDVLITINHEDFARAAKHFHAKRLEYVPGIGIDIKKFSGVELLASKKRQKLGIPMNAKILLSVGELNANKNHEIVLRALAALDDSDIFYIIAGEGGCRNMLEGLARGLGISDRVKLLGFCANVSELYHTADAYIHPSLREGLPVSVMEAMASGLPIVCSNIRGCKDLVDENCTFDPHDVNSVKNKIQAILYGETKEIVSANYRHLAAFDISGVQSLLQDSIDKCLSGGDCDRKRGKQYEGNCA